MRPSDITAVILTRDEERNLPRAMTSLPRGVNVLVVDAQSTDGTLSYARKAGATVIERPWTNFVDARRFALAHVRTPWTFVLDADEALDDVLRDALLAAPEDANGYTVARTTFFRGKRMRMWSKERLLRLMRTDAARVEAAPAAGGSAALHERYACDPPIGELPGELLHYSYSDTASYRERFARYTSIEATGLRRDAAATAWQTLLVAPRLVNNLLRRGALLDGPRGWYVAWYSALYPAVVRWKSR